ncbi:MAG: hypothetical protein IE931_01200 [Sphingobacteriales bacterium]|nr:hypothetical protein [Sphingobacteriales bacterium]
MQNSLQKIRQLQFKVLTLKSLLILILIVCFKESSFAQTTGSVGIGTTTPYANAILDVTSNTKGVLLPRLSATDRNTLTPKLGLTANGLMIYNTTTLKFNYWDGTKWNDVGAGATGPAGTIWYAGQGVPSNTIGKPNDFYLDGISGDVYSKDLDNVWVKFGASNPVNLKNTNKIEVAGAAFNVPATSSVTQTFTFTGAVVGNAAVCSPNSALPDGLIISYARVSATDTIEVKFYNATGTAISVAAGNYELAIVK